MKKLSSVFGLLTLAAVLAAGCVKEEPNYKKGGVQTDETIGYLALGNLDLNVVVDADQNTDKNLSSTRAANPNFTAGDEAGKTDDYYVEILPVDGGAAAYAGLFKDLKARIGDEKAANGKGMALPVGAYTVKAWSNLRDDRTPALLQDTPSYMGVTPADKPLRIVKGQVAEGVQVTCTLINIKVTVEIEESLRKNQAGESILDIEEAWVNLGDTRFIYKDASGWDTEGVSAGQKSDLAFDGPTRPIYFRAVNTENLLQFHFKATPKEGSAVTLNKNIPNVKGGHWRKIKVVGKHDTQGNLTFDIEVSTLVQDETIQAGDDVNDPQSSAWTEDTMVDPDDVASAPKVEWQGGDVNADIPVGASNPSGNMLTITSINGIASVALAVSTSNPEFASDAQAMTVADLCQIASSRTLTTYGIPFGGKLLGKQEVSFSLDGIMNQLRGYDGRYVFTLTITDQKGFTTTQALTFAVGAAPAYTQPLIEWSEGEFDRDVTLTSDMQINIKLTAQPHFESIKVEIISDELGADVLAVVPLPTVFDLCNLQDFTFDGELKTAGEQAVALTQNLHLIDVVNDDLKQLSEANFVITPFVSILDGFETGRFYFRLTVVDADNHAATKTLQLVK